MKLLFPAVVIMTTEYKLYKRRWLFLITVASLNMICMFISVGFSPVASLVTQYYKITGDEIDLLVLIGWAINVTGMLFSIYCIGRFHLLVALRYSATVTFLGGLIRVLSTSIGSDTISHETQFWITFAGQIVTSFGTSTVVCMSTKVSFQTYKVL